MRQDISCNSLRPAVNAARESAGRLADGQPVAVIGVCEPMILALVGIVVSFLAYLIAFPDRNRRRFDIYLALLALHLAATIGYWLYHFESAMDAFLYYRDPFNFYQLDAFASGTYFIVHVVQTLKGAFGGSFLDYFLLFQCFGMIAIALMIRAFTDIADSLGIELPLPAYALLFLPGLHFWSVAIGKDAPMLMAIALAVWSAIRIQQRFIWLGVAILIMVAIRPHVGAITLLAVLIAFLAGRNVSTLVRLALVPPVIVGLLVSGGMAGERLGIDVTDAESVSGFLEYQQSLGEAHGAGDDLQSLPFPMKVATLLFRPFFFDAKGIMGLVASFENLVLLLLFGWAAMQWRMLIRLVGRVYHVSFCLTFSAVLTIGLALINYNVGLGQRQKMMIMPAVLLVVVTLYLYRRFLAQQAQASAEETDTAASATAAA